MIVFSSNKRRASTLIVNSPEPNFNTMLLSKIMIIFVAVILVFSVSDAKRKKHSKAMILRQKETNAVDFIRLVSDLRKIKCL